MGLLLFSPCPGELHEARHYSKKFGSFFLNFTQAIYLHCKEKPPQFRRGECREVPDLFYVRAKNEIAFIRYHQPCLHQSAPYSVRSTDEGGNVPAFFAKAIRLEALLRRNIPDNFLPQCNL